MTTAAVETSSPGRRRLLLVLSACFVLIALAYIGMTMWLASADKSLLTEWELNMRMNESVPYWIRSWHRGAHADIVQHFVIYLLPGMMAGFAGTLAAEWLGQHRRRSVIIATASFWMLLAAIDELRQLNVPSRSTSLSDLFSGWAGILVGLGIYTALRLALKWLSGWWRARKTV